MKSCKTKILLICIAGLLLGFLFAFASAAMLLAAMFGIAFTVILFRDFRRMTYVVALYVFIDYAVRNYSGSPALAGYWDELLLILAVGLWIYKMIRYRKLKPFTHTPLDFPLIGFFGVGLFLLIINSPDLRISIEGLRAVIQYMFWYFAAVQLFESEKTAKNMYRILVYSGTLLGLHGILQFIMKVENPVKWTDAAEGDITRVFSIIGSPNILGSLMVLLIPMAAGLFFAASKPLEKLLFLGSAGAMCLCLLFTFSRGAWLGLAVAAFVYFAIKDKRLLVPIVVLGLLAVIFVPSITGRITYMLSSQYVASSIKGGRLGRLEAGLEILRSNLWIGVGLGRFGGAVAMNNIPGSYYMDNYYLKTTLEMGIVGLMAFLALIFSLLSWSRRVLLSVRGSTKYELVLGAFAGMCGVLFHNLFENVFEVPMMVTYFWLLAAFIMVQNYRAGHVNQ